MISTNKDKIILVLKKNLCIQVTYAQIYHKNAELIAEYIIM